MRSFKLLRLLAIVTLIAVAPTGHAQAPTAPAQAPARRAQPPVEPATGITGDFSLAAAGDSLVTMRFSMSTEPEFLQLMKIFRDSDVGFTNLETLFHDFQSATDPQFTGTLLRSNPNIAEDLKWAGFTLFGRGNNHAGDYGEHAMRQTTETLDRLGMVHAGVGRTLGEARRPGYLNTSKGRIALIAATSTFLPASRAGDSRGDLPGRPGVSTLRATRIFKVDSGQLAELSAIAEKLGLRVPRPNSTGGFSLFGTRFQVAAAPGSEWTVNEKDVREILASVREARRQADFVILTIHSHESGKVVTEPPSFITDIAKAAIDAGADAFIGHGPHQLRGVEIYKGKPIYYSLGNFFFENDAVERLPADFYEKFGLSSDATTADALDARDAQGQGFADNPAYFDSAVTRARYRDGRLVSLTLYPITLGFQTARSHRGRPLLASPADGKRIIENLAKYSAPYGTKIEYRDGVGVIDLEAHPPTSPVK